MFRPLVKATNEEGKPIFRLGPAEPFRLGKLPPQTASKPWDAQQFTGPRMPVQGTKKAVSVSFEGRGGFLSAARRGIEGPCKAAASAEETVIAPYIKELKQDKAFHNPAALFHMILATGVDQYVSLQPTVAAFSHSM